MVDARKNAAKYLKEAVADYDYLTPQAEPEGYQSAYWTMVLKLDTDRVSWEQFRKKFMNYGGDGIYGAWKLGYLEPMYQKQNLMGREKMLSRYGVHTYESGLCPVAEEIQPKLLQFKTNYWNESDAIQQAEILRKTAKSF